MAYSKTLLEHYEKPKNVGSLDKESNEVGTGLVGAPACGDVMKLQIKVNNSGVIEDAKFKTFGCGSAIASSSLVTEMVKGKNINAAWNGKTLQVKMKASKKFSSTIAAMMEVTVQNVNDILRVHEDDKFIEMKLLDTDTILVEDYFDKPSNFWSLAGMNDALTKLVGLCSLNTQEGNAEKAEPNQKTKTDEQVSLDGIRL